MKHVVKNRLLAGLAAVLLGTLGLSWLYPSGAYSSMSVNIQWNATNAQPPYWDAVDNQPPYWD